MGRLTRKFHAFWFNYLRFRAHLHFIEVLLKAYLLSVFIFGSVAMLSAFPKFHIAWISIIGTDLVSGEQVFQITEQELHKRSLLLIRRNLPLWAPNAHIAAAVYASDHHIHSVNVTTNLSRTITVTIEEEEPSYLWCGEDIPGDPSEILVGCYFANMDGKIFAQAQEFIGDSYLVFFTTPAQLFRDQYFRENDFPLGYHIADDVTMKKLRDIRDALSEHGYQVFKAGVTTDADVVVYTRENVRFLFALSRDITEDTKRLFALEEALREGGEVRLMEVDLRFPAKIYYQ